jgi:hypothetical protein
VALWIGAVGTIAVSAERRAREGCCWIVHCCQPPRRAQSFGMYIAMDTWPHAGPWRASGRVWCHLGSRVCSELHYVFAEASSILASLVRRRVLNDRTALLTPAMLSPLLHTHTLATARRAVLAPLEPQCRLATACC